MVVGSIISLKKKKAPTAPMPAPKQIEEKKTQIPEITNPNPKPVNEVIFPESKTSGNVTIKKSNEAGGVDITTLTREEYKAMIKQGGVGSRGGAEFMQTQANLTPRVKALMDLEEKNRIKSMMQRQIEQNALKAELMGQIAKEKGFQETELPSLESMQSELPPLEAQGIGATDQFKITEAIPNALTSISQFKPARNLLSGVAQALSAMTSVLPDVLQVGTKPSGTVTAYQNTFNDVDSAIAKDIDMIKITGDYQAALDGIEDAIEVNRKIEQQAYGYGLVNARYWVTDGKELEAQIILNNRKLEQRRREIIMAVNSFNLNMATAQTPTQ